MTEVAGKNVAVLGYGAEGRSAVTFLLSDSAKVTLCDEKKDLKLPEGVSSRLGDGYLSALDDFDLIVPSPGIPRSRIKTTKPVVSPTQLFLERCPAPIIGVTGTKGKGTTCTLIAKMLEAADKTVHLGGNIGRPALDLLADVKKDDYAVLELSSFQLYDITTSPHIAVVLMIEPDHLDWHPDMADYVAAKTRLVQFQKPEDVVVFHAQNQFSKQIGEASPGRKIAYLGPEGAHIEDDSIVIESRKVISTGDVGLIGPHNLENICAAVTAVSVALPSSISHLLPSIVKVLRDFRGLEHRLEFVREANGVKYYNDSFATNPTATIAALRSFDNPVILIAGGSDKGADFTPLSKEIASRNVKKVLLVGETAPKLAKSLEAAGYREFELSEGKMESLVPKTAGLAASGDVVLLSPACASFGLFDNYKQRGELFKQAVGAL